VIDLLVSCAVTYCIDQYSKTLAMAQSSGPVAAARPVIAIRHVASSKRLFASERARALLMVLWVLALIAAIALQQLPSSLHGRAAAIGLGVALGGAAGNMMDIRRSGSVRDFISIGWWPRFNVADVAILGGLALSLLAG